MVDVTCRNPVNLGTPPPAPDMLESWFRNQEQEKIRKYVVTCRMRGYSFIPFVMTPWGGLGPAARKVAFRLLRLILGETKGWIRIQKSQQFWRKLSFAVAKPVARQLAAMKDVTQPPWNPNPVCHSPYTFEFPGLGAQQLLP